MKKCRTVKGLVKAITKGEFAVLKVWDIMPNGFDQEGAYLNMGEGRYVYVRKENWNIIRNYVVNQEELYCKNLMKYKGYYRDKIKVSA
ncbi:hypothetical protein PP175_29520 (plasmid) [Aneurinibacillus sp. Ricciae_BoGa-3]|uniref:hypothetical protein n=1 Tax=Aneurinibacillus sp. Ricciae_BoGa-3 TaxID=3022697 RepID=UPI00234004C6|nr:hypothetical protein [Aneurinibacillus sp. Ricciae_BoGa-3]WCK57332.1 hypothetical protein PP175_29520 [Aneurinibacillus sp. Ricciae_BoGa-3]